MNKKEMKLISFWDLNPKKRQYLIKYLIDCIFSFNLFILPLYLLLNINIKKLLNYLLFSSLNLVFKDFKLIPNKSDKNMYFLLL